MSNTHPLTAYAMVVKGTHDLCYTSAPEMINGGRIYQIYLTKKEAKEFLKLQFSDAEYEIVKVIVYPYDATAAVN
jgi:hypothetical protein